MHQQVAEIAGVQRREAGLIGDIEIAAAAVGEGAGVALGNIGGAETLVLPGVDHAGELPGRPALVVEVFGLDQLLDQADDVVGIEDGEIGAEADELGVAAEQLDADRVEGAEPGHAFDGAADEQRDALLHLAGGLVGEGDGEDLRGEGAAGVEDVGDAGGQHARLAGAGAGEHQHRAFQRLDGFGLLGVETGEIIRPLAAIARRHGAGGEPPPAAGALAGAARLRLARRFVGLFVEEGDIVETVAHGA